MESEYWLKRRIERAWGMVQRNLSLGRKDAAERWLKEWTKLCNELIQRS